MKEIKLKYKEKEYEFKQTNLNFRLWGNKFIEKYNVIMKPAKELETKRTKLMLQSEAFKNEIDVNKTEEETTQALIDKWKNNQIQIDNELLIIQLELTELYDLLLDKLLFGYFDDNNNFIEGYYKELINNCVKDFDLKELDLNEDEGIKFVKEVLNGFFTKKNKRVFY